MKLPFIEKTFISSRSTFEESRIVILGCPYDGSSTFRPGARFGPSSIRKSSWGIETYSPYFKKDLEELSVHDMGDLELPLGEKTASLDLIKKALREILNAKKYPILLGGDHLITLPVVEEIYKIYPELHLIQIDAHTDLRNDYLGESLCHGTVMRRIIEIIGNDRLSQFGIRSGTKEEFKLAKRIGSIKSEEKLELKKLIKKLKDRAVYISLDLDAFDPSIIPGVGTPEPGGLTFARFLSIINELQSLNVIGFDIVELTPDYDQTQISSITTSIILREMILAFLFKKV